MRTSGRSRKDPSEPHVGRSAELQRLLEEAARADWSTRADPQTTRERASNTGERNATRSVRCPTRAIRGRRSLAGVNAVVSGGRPALAGVSRSVRLAAQRSAEQHRRLEPPAAGTRPGRSSRQLPVSRRIGLSIGAPRRRATTSRLFTYGRVDEAAAPTRLPPAPLTDHGSPKTAADDTGAPASSYRWQPAPPPQRTRQRAFVLAAGIAAAVIAVVAIAVGGRLATAPTSDGPPPAPTTADSVGTTVGATSSTPSPVVPAPFTPATATATASATPTPTPTAGDTASVVTGTSKLTGWITLAAPHG